MLFNLRHSTLVGLARLVLLVLLVRLETKKPTREFLQSSAVAERRLGLFHLDGTSGAFASTGTARNACIGIDRGLAVDFDCANGAGGFADTAAHADILIYFSSHCILQE